MRPPLDIDGSELPTPDPSSDVAHAAWWLLFCRRNHFQLRGMVRVGSVQMQEVVDLDQPRSSSVPDISGWEAAGMVNE